MPVLRSSLVVPGGQALEPRQLALGPAQLRGAAREGAAEAEALVARQERLRGRHPTRTPAPRSRDTARARRAVTGRSAGSFLPSRQSIRHHLVRRARQEHLVGVGQLRGEDRRLPALDAVLPAQVEHHRAGDPREDVVRQRRRAHLAVEDREEVAERALLHHAVADEQPLVGAQLLGPLRRERVGDERRDLDVAARPAHVGLQDGDRAGAREGGVRLERPRHREHRRLGVGRREDVGARRGAARDLDVDRRVARQAVLLEEADRDVLERHEVHADAHLGAARRQPGEVLAEEERLAVVRADPLVHAVAVGEPAVERADERFVVRQELPVEVDGGHGIQPSAPVRRRQGRRG